MGLDIGVVKLDYLERPEKTAYDFARHLAAHSDEVEWSVFAEGNIFVELTRDTMISLMDGYVSDKKLDQEDAKTVGRWVDALPWTDHVIMLHLNW